MVPSWNVGHSTFSKPDAHMMPLAGEGQRNGTVPRSWLFFVLRHFIWQELMRRAPPKRNAPSYPTNDTKGHVWSGQKHDGGLPHLLYPPQGHESEHGGRGEETTMGIHTDLATTSNCCLSD